MTQPSLVIIDVIALAALAFGLYFPRYRRKDMVVAIVGLNVGVMAVATALSSSNIGAGLGLGLFGVLSIIRLRSAELAQEEIAYYFTALAIGLLGGIQVSPTWLTPALMIVILVALFLGDHPRLFADNRNQIVTLDRAYTDEVALAADLETLLGGSVTRLKIRKTNLITHTTVVDVRYRITPKVGATTRPAER